MRGAIRIHATPNRYRVDVTTVTEERFGFTTQDQRRCQILARIVALIYNWWSLFTRLAIPKRHTEATTSRPLLLHGIGRQTKHSNQTTLTITSNHAQAGPVRRALESISHLLQRLAASAEHFDADPTPPHHAIHPRSPVGGGPRHWRGIRWAGSSWRAAG
jgi:hypothetical protein